MEFPACETAMVQLPPLTKDAVLPETVHTEVLSEEKLTGSPELDDALRLNDEPAD